MVYKDKLVFARGKEECYPHERILGKLTIPDIEFYTVDNTIYQGADFDYSKLLSGASAIVENLLMTTTIVKFKGKKYQKIYTVKDLTTTKQQKKSLPFNSYDYVTFFPSLSPDGETLIFASDMSGGFGGYDLYAS